MESILELKGKLDQQQLSILSSEMEKHKKSTGLAYVLWFFLGTLGIHKFYVGKIGMGVMYLLLGLIGWISLFVGMSLTIVEEGGAGGYIFSIIVFVVLAVLLLIDLFTLSRQIRKSYEAKELKCIKELFSKATVSEEN